MESAYDHIQEETLKSEQEEVHKGKQPEEGNLNTDFQEAYKAFSASPWGTKLGGFLGTVKKQGESYYQGARQEAVLAGEEALKGFTDLRSTIVNRARSLSLGEQQAAESSEDRLTISPSKENTSTAAKEVVPDEKEADSSQGSKDIDDKTIQESEGIISRFKAEAEKRLKDIQKAEDAADEALLQFGTNISNFFRDAVTIAPPGDEKDKDGKTKVLFESKDSEGKRVIHTTRFDAQLHVIHCNLDSFTKDPASPEYAAWRDGDFSVERKTDDIASDLEKYDELRRAMEKLVPEKVEYEQFWRRYYFLRMVIETEEKRRKEILKGAASAEEEVGWDEDSDEEPSTPQPQSSPRIPPSAQTPKASKSLSDDDTTRPAEPRKSQDQQSQSGSDGSYDLVSGATSRAPGSPRDDKKKEKKDESDEEDWE